MAWCTGWWSRGDGSCCWLTADPCMGFDPEVQPWNNVQYAGRVLQVRWQPNTATESGIVDFQHGWRGLAIDAWELVKNVSNSHSCVPSLDAGIIQPLKASFMLASSALKQACLMFCINKKKCFWRLNVVSMVACSILVSGVRRWSYMVLGPGLTGNRNGFAAPTRRALCSQAMIEPFHPWRVDCRHGRHWRARLKWWQRAQMCSKFGRGSNDGILLPTRVATSS